MTPIEPQISKDDLKLLILNAVVATSPDVFTALTTGTGLSPAVKILEKEFEFGEGFFNAPKEDKPAGPGYTRIRRLRTSIRNDSPLEMAASEDYPPGSSHKAYVNKILSFIK